MLNAVFDKSKIIDFFGTDETEKIETLLRRNGLKILNLKPEELMKHVKNSDSRDSFLIIGGHKLFPFYEAENPAGDGDRVVWTDNYYASTDGDPLLPERAIGRLPDGNNPDFLKNQIKKLNTKDTEMESCFGLSAAVWKKASLYVYQVISDEKLLLSPPENHETIEISEDTGKLYFNLHGSDRSNKWYGQGDGRYPVALTPGNVPELNDALLYTEACYGAYTIGKEISQSLALTFLESGVRYFVGSTTIAYGPRKPPPAEADLIGYLFFKEVLSGKSIGESLLEAKHKFFREMIERQGFLDPNDKKTLLQFVLFGNPEGKLRKHLTL